MRTGILRALFFRKEKESILDLLMEGVMVLDGAGVIRYVNRAFAKLISLSRSELLNSSIALSKKELLVRIHALMTLAQRQKTIITDSMTLEEEQTIFLDLIIVPKQKKGAVILLQDKSSQHQVVEMGKEFIANVSHELRTPLTIIRGFAETLQDMPLLSRPMVTEIVEKIVRNCERMNTLVKNLLTLSDLEHVPHFRFQSCDLAALVDRCKDLLLTLAPKTQIKIEKSKESILIDGDADLLELALMNLLENGVKYSTPPAHLTIALDHKENNVIIAIQDRGIGISAQDLPHIFERFYTVDKSHSRRLGGAGLGLSIVKTIINKHEGTLVVASQPGQGTTFTITLPCSRH